MNKIFFTFAVSTLLTFNVSAAEKIDYTDPEATAIAKKCDNNDSKAENRCLKNELIKIIGNTFDGEQKDYLLNQINEIEKNVNEARLNLDNEQIKQFSNNQEAEEELRRQSLNQIWQKLLNDTIKMIRGTAAEA